MTNTFLIIVSLDDRNINLGNVCEVLVNVYVVETTIHDLWNVAVSMG